jgi:chromosome partitioning protein
MFTLVITNRKGGTAKTTTAVNLAAEFARQGKRCLLIDLDPQGHAGIGLGFSALKNGSQPQSILHNGRQSMLSLLHETAVDNLFYVPPGDHDSSRANPDRLISFIGRKQLQEQFDIVVMDTPPHKGIEQQAALMAADGVLVPFMPTPLGKAGVQDITRDIDELNLGRSNRLKYGLIPIMMDTRVRLDNQILSELIGLHGMERILRGVRRNVKVAEAFDAGKPVHHYDAGCRGAFDYHMLAEDLSSIWPDLYPQQDTLSFKKPVLASLESARPAAQQRSHRGIRLKDHCPVWNN